MSNDVLRRRRCKPRIGVSACLPGNLNAYAPHALPVARSALNRAPRRAVRYRARPATREL
jgi:hypothetical protein